MTSLESKGENGPSFIELWEVSLGAPDTGLARAGWTDTVARISSEAGSVAGMPGESSRWLAFITRIDAASRHRETNRKPRSPRRSAAGEISEIIIPSGTVSRELSLWVNRRLED